MGPAENHAGGIALKSRFRSGGYKTRALFELSVTFFFFFLTDLVTNILKTELYYRSSICSQKKGRNYQMN